MVNANNAIKYSGAHKFLSAAKIKKVVDSAFRILSEIGMKTTEKKSRQILENAGAKTDGEIVKLPHSLIEDCISSSPDSVDIYNQTGDLAMSLGGRNGYFGANVDAPVLLDTENNEYKKCLEKDIGRIAHVADSLANISFLTLNGFAADKPSKIAERVAFRQCVFNSNKPIMTALQTPESLSDIYDMAIKVTEDREFNTSPFFINYAEPVSPLMNPDDSLKKVIFSAENSIPLLYSPYLAMGATAPQSPAAALSQAIAESLFGLVLHQLVEKGSKFILGAMPSLMDMKTSVFTYGAPETQLLCSGVAEISNYLELPSFGTAGTGDSHNFDGQAVLEATSSSYMAVMSGANLIHDPGLFGSGKILIPEMIVVVDEIVEMLRHSLTQIDVDEDSFCFETLKEVGPGGEFVSHKHTLSNFREIWYPDLMDRAAFEEGEKDYETFKENVKDKLNEIISGYSEERFKLKSDLVNSLKDMEENW